MPILKDDVPNQLDSVVSGVQGKINFKLECRPGFDYARRKHTVERRGDAVVFRPEGHGHSSDGADRHRSRSK